MIITATSFPSLEWYPVSELVSKALTESQMFKPSRHARSPIEIQSSMYGVEWQLGCNVALMNVDDICNAMSYENKAQASRSYSSTETRVGDAFIYKPTVRHLFHDQTESYTY